MTAKILDGKILSAEIKNEIGAEVKKINETGKRAPGLAVVLVGEDPGSKVYVGSKRKTCAELGFYSPEHTFAADIKPEILFSTIDALNRDERVDGILVQSPLPKGFDEFAVTMNIDPDKDVDGFHPVNVGKLMAGKETFVACTPLGVQVMLMRNGIDVAGKHVVIVGRSNIVGKPLAALLVQKKKGADATVTVCHSRTKNLPAMTRQAEVLIAAMGVPKFITADMVSDGAIVVDVGINRIADASTKSGFRLVGDVDFENVSKKASWITPVPGGVGLMTIAMLMNNTLESYKRRTGWR